MNKKKNKHKIDYLKLYDIISGDMDVYDHKRLPAKRIRSMNAYRTICIHGFMWGEGEKIPCKRCLDILRGDILFAERFV